jgi:hypothetical protein
MVLAQPSHSPGVLALWRADDRTLVVGDGPINLSTDPAEPRWLRMPKGLHPRPGGSGRLPVEIDPVEAGSDRLHARLPGPGIRTVDRRRPHCRPLRPYLRGDGERHGETLPQRDGAERPDLAERRYCVTRVGAGHVRVVPHGAPLTGDARRGRNDRAGARHPFKTRARATARMLSSCTRS